MKKIQKEDLEIGTLLTKRGNDLEYSECSSCGVVEVNGTKIEDID